MKKSLSKQLQNPQKKEKIQGCPKCLDTVYFAHLHHHRPKFAIQEVCMSCGYRGEKIDIDSKNFIQQFLDNMKNDHSLNNAKLI